MMISSLFIPVLFFTATVSFLQLLCLTAAWRGGGRDRLLRGSLISFVLILLHSSAVMFGDSVWLLTPSILSICTIIFICLATSTGLEYLAGQKSLRESLTTFEKKSLKQEFIALPSNIFIGVLLAIAFLATAISAALIGFSLNYYGDPKVFAMTAILLTVGLSSVVVLSAVLGNTIWPRCWGGIKVVACQLVLTATLVSIVIFSTLVWNNFVAVNECIDIAGFDESGNLVVVYEGRNYHKLHHRAWRVIEKDGSARTLSEFTPDTKSKPVRCSKTGWVYRDAQKEHQFDKGYSFRGICDGNLIFRIPTAKRTGRLIKVDTTSFGETTLFDTTDIESIVVAPQSIIFIREETLYLWSPHTELFRPLLSLGQKDSFLTSSPKKQKLIVENESAQLTLVDSSTGKSKYLSTPAGEDSETLWLSENLLISSNYQDEAFLYSTTTGQWTRLEGKIGRSSTLDPTSSFVYSRIGHATIQIHDLQGKLVHKLDVSRPR